MAELLGDSGEAALDAIEILQQRLAKAEAERDELRVSFDLIAEGEQESEASLAKAVEGLRWYAEQNWDTGEVHYGHGDKARSILSDLEGKGE